MIGRLRAVRLVAMREILERGRSRGYLLSLLFTVILLGAGFVLPALLLGQEKSPKLALVDPVPAGLEAAIEGIATQYKVTLDISHVSDQAAGEAAVRDKAVDAALAIPVDLSTAGDLIVLDDPDGQIQAITSNAVIGLRAGAQTALLTPPTVTSLEPPTAEHTTALIFANAGIILMFIGIFTYGTWVLTGVVEEKQSRVVEVVLTTVRPRDLLMGKVLGIGLLALVQLVIIVTAGLAAAQLSGRLTLPATTVSAVVQLLAWFILGFAFYSTAMGFLGSLASRVDEASNASMPVTMTATLSYLLSILLVTQEPNGIVATILTFFPPSAPMVVPLRTALGAIQPWEAALSIVLMIAAIWVLFVVGGRVYSGAVLQTGGRMKLRDAWRASR
jgi:ABC-2 type transport system permease protein